MKRRSFLSNSVVLSSFSILSPLLSFMQQPRRTVAMPGADSMKAFAANQLEEFSIATLQQRFKAGTLSCVQLVQMYMHRIKALNKTGPDLRALITLNPNAEADAAERDAERRSGKAKGAMHGIPIVVKDNINTLHMATTAGSIALASYVPDDDAFVVKKLMEAGAIILAKANLSEWANIRDTDSQSGWSSVGGQCKNPYYLDRNPSGSSSGSAVAVAANFCTVAVGTETDGSIVSPSSHCGIVGLKPTVGLISRSGIIPISHTQDTAGPMGRSVEDVAMMLGAMTGVDSKDDVTSHSKDLLKKNYAEGLHTASFKAKRIGYDPLFLKGRADLVALFRSALDTMKAQGAELVECDLMTPTRELGESEWTVLITELKEDLKTHFAKTKSPVKSLADIMKFNSAHASEVMPYFGQSIFEEAERTSGLHSDEYNNALLKTTSARGIIDELMKSKRLDAICGTTTGAAGCIDHVNGDYRTGPSFSSPAAMAGYPHITLPMGYIKELPVGLSFISTAYKEQELLMLAAAYEKVGPKRRPPMFIPTMK